MTRILSVFNLMKRVGFAVLLWGGTSNADWYQDATNPEWRWQTTTDPTIVSDGLGGAFFAFTRINQFWPHIGHVNSRGNLTFPPGQPAFTNMLPVDSVEYSGTPLGVMLVPSQPIGSVIAVVERIQGEFYSGLTFAKFDTLGPSGFGSVSWNDNRYRIPPTQVNYAFGSFAVVSDENGGVHFCLRDSTGASYYNLLLSNGQLVYPWPGLLTPHTNWARNLVADGTGGIFMFKLPVFSDSDSIWAQRFDRNGQASWVPDGRVVIANSTNMWNESYLLREGVVMIRDQIEVGPNEYVHRVHAIDTTGEHVWSPQGIELVCGGGESIRIFVDGVGGFFHSFRASDGVFRTCHYDGNANLIAAGADGLYLHISDSSGGGFNKAFYHDTFPFDTAYFSHQRFDSAFQAIWPTPTAVIDLATEIWANEYVPDGMGGVLGIISANEGVTLYHVDANGVLGGYLAVQEREMPISTNIGLKAYPNPFNQSLTVSFNSRHGIPVDLIISDILGRQVHKQHIMSPVIGSNSISLHTDFRASGIYFLTATSSDDISNSQNQPIRILLIK